jgi:hypothetical protein
MDAACPLAVNPTTLAALSEYLRDSGSTLSLSEAATLAIGAWLAAENDRDLAAAGWASAPRPGTAGAGGYGYQWKELFLPDGTELRMSSDGEVHHARVTGDAIVYQGRRVSPREFTRAIAGDGRNAWRDLSVRLPGEKHFRPAALLRRNVQVQIAAAAHSGIGPEGGGAAAGAKARSPADTIAAAAQAMSEALRAAPALVEHCNAQSLRKYERRVEYHRRASDVMAGHVQFD